MNNETQSESLQDMVNQIPADETPQETDVQTEAPEEPTGEQEVPQEAEAQEEEVTYDVSTTDLNSWFNTHHESFPDIRTVAVDVTGVDSNETLLFTVPHPKGGRQTSRQGGRMGPGQGRAGQYDNHAKDQGQPA